MDDFVTIEKPDGYDAHNGVGGDGDQHADGASDVAGHEQNDEDFQRVRLDARRIDERLVDEVVDQLRT